MKIALQFAMPSEFHALPGARDLEPAETVSGVPLFEAGPGILACAGGVSKVNAAMAAELLCLKYGVDLILNAGVAGCLTDLPTGTLVVASEFVQHDVDTTAVGDPIGLVSTVNQVAFPTWQPERCAEILASLGHPAVTGRVATGDWFAVKGERAAFIRDTFSPLLTEMEGGAIAQVCLRNNVRFVSVKSVSDHLFSDSQAEEYFDFGQALEALGRAVLPLARALLLSSFSFRRVVRLHSEHFLNGDAEHLCDVPGQDQGGVVPPFFQIADGLPPDPHQPCQILLLQVQTGPVLLHPVADHGSSPQFYRKPYQAAVRA